MSRRAHYFFVGIFSFLFSFQARGQCPAQVKSPGDVLAYVIYQTKAQRTKIYSTANQAVITSTLEKTKTSAEFIRFLDNQGRVSYQQIPRATENPRAIRFAIERDVVSSPEDRRRTEFTDENYFFQFLEGDKNLLRFKLTPVERREGLVDGEYIIDANLCRPVRAQGHVFNGHFLVRQFDLTEDFQVIKGIIFPQRMFIEYKIFAIFKMVKGTLETLSHYRPEDVILNPSNL